MGFFGPSSKDLKSKSNWAKADRHAAKARKLDAKGKWGRAANASNKAEAYARRSRGLGW
jgi:hypothetical protein